MLGGGFKHVLFSPLFLGNDPIRLTCFNWIVNQDLACHISDIDLLGHSVTKFSVIFLCFRCGVHLLFPNPENLPPSWVKSRRFAISGACGYLAAWPALQSLFDRQPASVDEQLRASLQRTWDVFDFGDAGCESPTVCQVYPPWKSSWTGR